MFLRILVIAILLVVSLLGVGWLGFRVPAPSFAALAAGDLPAEIQIPSSLPAPLMRHLRAVYGETVPQVQTAVVSGRAWVTFNGLTMPARFRFSYDVKRGHYHDIQVTWYTLKVMQIHERFLDGRSILSIPFMGRIENDPYNNAASNQGFWAELLAWVPALAVTDARVRWEAIDDSSVRLIVPNADPIEAFTVRFDPATGLMTSLVAQRYRDSALAVRERWLCEALEWREIDGAQVMATSTIRWGEAAPWVTWEVEQVALNVDVAARWEQFGG
jgi:hypothetical protein